MGFVVWTLVPVIDDQLLRTEVGYAVATATLATILWRIYRSPAPAPTYS